jgi:hypothetical protein
LFIELFWFLVAISKIGSVQALLPKLKIKKLRGRPNERLKIFLSGLLAEPHFWLLFSHESPDTLEV